MRRDIEVLERIFAYTERTGGPMPVARIRSPMHVVTDLIRRGFVREDGPRAVVVTPSGYEALLMRRVPEAARELTPVVIDTSDREDVFEAARRGAR